jgi:hypothetical protein
METEKKRQTTLRVPQSHLWYWQDRVHEMKQCVSPEALVALHGPPHLKIKREGVEIWHYRLETYDEKMYSIQVSMHKDEPMRVVLCTEPVKPTKVRWWQFWKW